MFGSSCEAVFPCPMPGVGSTAFACPARDFLEIAEKPPKRMALVSQRIKGIALAGRKAALGLCRRFTAFPADRHKIRACANATVQHQPPLTAIGNLCHEGFFAAAEIHIFKSEGPACPACLMRHACSVGLHGDARVASGRPSVRRGRSSPNSTGVQTHGSTDNRQRRSIKWSEVCWHPHTIVWDFQWCPALFLNCPCPAA